MARFEQGHVKLTSGKVIYLTANEIGHNGTDFTFSSTISGVAPTESYHLVNMLYVDTISGTLQTDIDTKGTGTMSDLVDDTTPQLGGDLDTNSSDILFGTDTISGTGSIYTDDNIVSENLVIPTDEPDDLVAGSLWIV